MLSLLLILLGLGQLTSAGYNSETSLLQITIPQKIQTNRINGGESEMHVTYAIKMDRKIYTILLEKQSVLDAHFLVYLYNKSGVLYTDSLFVKDHCFYQGHVAEIPKSAVTLSICSGLRGLLQLENVSYGIEPLEFATTYEHMLYQINNDNIDFLPLKENYSSTESADKSYRIFVKSEISKKNSDVVLQKRILKIQVIMDKALYDYMGSEVAVATEKVIHIFSLINAMFSQLNVTVMLSSLEIWSDQNKISSYGHADEVLQRFVSWREKFLLQRFSDMTYLLVYRDHASHVGTVYHGKACDPKLAAGVALYPKMITSESFSIVMAQLLAINLGLTYDDIYTCQCPETTCIMNPEAIRSHGVKFFSSCSMDEFKSVVSQPEFQCLQKQTASKLILQAKNSVCGNGILEAPEQCDCGPVENCTHKRCCRAQDCSLIKLSQCGSGTCCDKKTCQILPRGRVCRKRVGLCDFTEFCNGVSEFCVPDMKSHNFEPCENETAFCYDGECKDPDVQCLQLFGKFAKISSHVCAQEVNFMGDEFGHCKKSYQCNYGDILCGKLVCHWTHTLIVPSTLYDIQYTYLDGHICMSGVTRNKSIVQGSDKTFVADGTMCGHRKYCKEGTCELLTGKDICNSTEKCDGHGVCNSAGHCHCDIGYAPPDCQIAPGSPGGSIDDGFWIIVSKDTELFVNKRASRKQGLLISFYVFLPFLILTTTVVLKWHKIKRFCKTEGTVSGGFQAVRNLLIAPGTTEPTEKILTTSRIESHVGYKFF